MDHKPLTQTEERASSKKELRRLTTTETCTTTELRQCQVEQKNATRAFQSLYSRTRTVVFISKTLATRKSASEMRVELALASVALLAICQNSAAAPKPEWHLKKMEMWKKQRAQKAETTLNPRHIYDTGAANSHSGKFMPTALRCCKLGEKIAKKQLSCVAADYHPEAVSGPGNDDRKRPLVTADQSVRLLMKKLSPKVDRCMTSKYSFNFTKCCSYRRNRAHELEACKRHLRRVDRRRCRKNVRKTFP